MLVEIWSDVVCPWCYIGKRRFDEARERFTSDHGEVDIQVTYLPFQLDPTAPPGAATPVAEVYAKKFGGPEQATRIFEHLTQVGAADGLDLRFDLALRANTMLAHQLLWMADQDPTVDQAAVKERLLAAYFTHGRNLGDPEVVAACGAAAGMDGYGIIGDDLRSRLEAGTGRAEVVEQLARAASQGISAVPTYVFDGQWAVPGAQDVDVFLRVFERLSDRTRGEQVERG